MLCLLALVGFEGQQTPTLLGHTATHKRKGLKVQRSDVCSNWPWALVVVVVVAEQNDDDGGGVVVFIHGPMATWVLHMYVWVFEKCGLSFSNTYVFWTWEDFNTRTKCTKGAQKVHSFVVTNFVCWISSCWMTKQATTTVQCNGMQCSPAQRAFSQMCDDLHASCQVKYLTNPTCFFGYGYISKPDKLQTHLDHPFFLLYPYCPNATQTSPKCHPNISKRMPPKHPHNKCHPNISPKRMPPKHPQTNATQTSHHWMLGLYYTTLLPPWWQK